jgi:hypothetical protein
MLGGIASLLDNGPNQSSDYENSPPRKKACNSTVEEDTLPQRKAVYSSNSNPIRLLEETKGVTLNLNVVNNIGNSSLHGRRNFLFEASENALSHRIKLAGYDPQTFKSAPQFILDLVKCSDLSINDLGVTAFFRSCEIPL